MTKAAAAKSWTLHEWADGAHKSWAEPEEQATALSTLVASMESGAWSELADVSGMDSWGDTRLPSTDHLFEFGTHLRWDSVGRRGYFLGGSHTSLSGVASEPALLEYDEAANTWARRTLPGHIAYHTDTVYHGYQSFAVDPVGRRAFNMPTNATGTGALYQGEILSDGDIVEWTSRASLPQFVYTGAIVWFADTGRLISIAGASLPNGFVYAYDPSGDSWDQLDSFNPTGQNHQWIEYVPGGQCVVFGGGNSATAIYKLDAAGNVTQMPTPTFATGTGSQEQKCIFAGDQDDPYLWVVTPDRELWRLDTTGSGSWQQMTSPGITGGGNAGVWDCTGGMVRTPESKCILIAEWRGSSAGRTWAYKP